MVGAGVVAVALVHAVNCSPAQPPAAALAAWSPDGAHIVYTVPYDETGAIQVAEPGAPLPTAGYVSYDSAPVTLVWSPLGDAIAFEKRTGAIEVLSLGRNGGSRELVHAEAGKTTELADWSPDGRQLVFARDGHIHTLDVGTGDIRYLVDGSHPAWSPDGQEIAFVAGNELRAIKPDGSGLRTVAVAVAPIGAVTGSPDSARLAFLVKNIGVVARFAGAPVYYGQAEPPLAWRENGIFYSLQTVAP